MTSKPSIYISSTFFDLEQHRKELVEALRKTECFDVVNMESYSTVSQSPLEKCLADVSASEFYILLLGNRYGFIPQGQKYSITNLEYKRAIGDTDENRVAGIPDRKKYVLPFLLNAEYRLPDPIIAKTEEEQKKDGEELTKRKQEYLGELKQRIKDDFTINPAGFTSPADLRSQVMGALIHQLVKDEKLSLLNKLKLPEEIVYRCNRERTRNDFLSRNRFNNNFYRVNIVHGAHYELPVIFSNNLSAYELQVRKLVSLRNLTNFFSEEPEKFIQGFILRVYEDIFFKKAESARMDFVQLASRIIDSDIDSVVIKAEIEYLSWKEEYKQQLINFFDAIKEANIGIHSSKTVYLLINIVYSSEREKISDKPVDVNILERLSAVKLQDIKDWVQTYFMQNTDTDTASQNNSEELAQKILTKYFPDRKKMIKGISMQDTIEQLKQIVNTFNTDNEQNLF